MQLRKLLLAAAATLPLVSLAHADDAACPADGTASHVVYEGKDIQGRIVRLTTPDVSVQTFDRVSSPKAATSANAHWTSRIGAGIATEAEH
jgi:hypothetical protein